MSPLDRRTFLHRSGAAALGLSATGLAGWSALQPDDGAWARWLVDRPEGIEDERFRGYRLSAVDFTDLRQYESVLPEDLYERYERIFEGIPSPEFESVRRFVNLPSGVVMTGPLDRSAVEGRFEDGPTSDRDFEFEADGTYRGFSVYAAQSTSLGAAVGNQAVAYGPTPEDQSEDAAELNLEEVVDTRLGDRTRYYTDDPVAYTLLQRLGGGTLFSLVDRRREDGVGTEDDGRVGGEDVEFLVSGQSFTVRGEESDMTRLRVYPDSVAADEADREEWKREVQEESEEIDELRVTRTGRLLELTGTRPTESL